MSWVTKRKLASHRHSIQSSGRVGDSAGCSSPRNSDIQVLGHPQTRVYDKREGLKADWHRVFGEAAKLDKAVEIDGYADRQDLRVSLLKKARKEGCRISLGTDAHAPSQLAYMELSLAAACLAKIPPDRILNRPAMTECAMGHNSGAFNCSDEPG